MPYRNNALRKIELLIRLYTLNQKNLEKSILGRICTGKGADIGCGSNKVAPRCIGIDLVKSGEIGRYGCEKNKASVSEYQSSGDHLFMFQDGELDFIVAKHNLEHYRDPDKALKEWKRVLKKGGRVGVIVPDDRYVKSGLLDPTHFSRFTPETLAQRFMENGFEILEQGVALKHWSIYLIARK